jgi:outer membrane protein TolC
MLEVPLTKMTKTFLGVSLLVATLCVAQSASAQSPLSLSEAIARAKAHNPDVGSAAAAEREAAERVTQVRGGYFPKVDVAESWQRGNHPVFVFNSLLAQGQGQFTAADFALDALNHPAATDNFRRRSLSSRCSIAPPRRMSGRVDRAGHGGHRQALVDQT